MLDSTALFGEWLPTKALSLSFSLFPRLHGFLEIDKKKGVVFWPCSSGSHSLAKERESPMAEEESPSTLFNRLECPR